jgi:hypothetical protein
MALALLCMTMFVLLTTASMRAMRAETRQMVSAEVGDAADTGTGAQR